MADLKGGSAGLVLRDLTNVETIYGKRWRTERFRLRRRCDVTNVETVYTERLRTIRVRRRRRYAVADSELATIMNAADAHALASVIFARLDDDQAHFVLFLCSAYCEVIGYKVLASGMQEEVVVDARMVFRNALLLGAHAIIAVHNHPSERLVPSEFDLDMTRDLARAGHVLDIELLDHLIWTRRGYTSIRDEHPALFEPTDS